MWLTKSTELWSEAVLWTTSNFYLQSVTVWLVCISTLESSGVKVYFQAAARDSSVRIGLQFAEVISSERGLPLGLDTNDATVINKVEALRHAGMMLSIYLVMAYYW